MPMVKDQVEAQFKNQLQQVQKQMKDTETTTLSKPVGINKEIQTTLKHYQLAENLKQINEEMISKDNEIQAMYSDHMYLTELH